jgi:hypothetical protein
MSDHERPVEPFSDLHVEEGHVRAVLLHDPTIEGLDMALYLDGSGSMKDEYAPRILQRGGGFLWKLFGIGAAPTIEEHPNQVEPQARWMLEYLATKDRNGRLRVAYWACKRAGDGIEVLGELTGVNASEYTFRGPKELGGRTLLAPAITDFIQYFEARVRDGARQGCAVFITDGQLHDAERVKELAAIIAGRVARRELPRVNFILVGVGDRIDEEQLEDICHQEYPGVGHLWCHRIAGEIKEVAELVAVLVDETMTVADGGVVYDDLGAVLRRYEGRLPAVLEFPIREGAKSFTLEVGGKRYTQPLPEGDHHDDDDDDHH